MHVYVCIYIYVCVCNDQTYNNGCLWACRPAMCPSVSGHQGLAMAANLSLFLTFLVHIIMHTETNTMIHKWLANYTQRHPKWPPNVIQWYTCCYECDNTYVYKYDYRCVYMYICMYMYVYTYMCVNVMIKHTTMDAGVQAGQPCAPRCLDTRAWPWLPTYPC